MIKIEKEPITSEGSLDLLATEVTLGVLHVWGIACRAQGPEIADALMDTVFKDSKNPEYRAELLSALEKKEEDDEENGE